MDTTKINQTFHNLGVRQEDRLDLFVQIFEGSVDGYDDIKRIITDADFTDPDMTQEIFMNLGSKYTKLNLDQFYTPLTISKFISTKMNPSGNAIDPAGGTGDLLRFHEGPKTVWDIDQKALDLCRLNFTINGLKDFTIARKNSLSVEGGNYDYVVMNPPFGTSTTVSDPEILSMYELGKGLKKQEIGMLFMELGLNLLRPGGTMFVIVPNGYTTNMSSGKMRDILIGNTIRSIIALPDGTFKRSGTGVGTSMIEVEKTPNSGPHPITFANINNIGYQLNKKNTPKLYKRDPETGGQLERDNDFDRFDEVGEVDLSPTLDGNILNPKRYLRNYKNAISREGLVRLGDVATIVKTKFKKEPSKIYNYIDIGSISTPFYNSTEMRGWELPTRAKFILKDGDVLISRLEGKLSYCVFTGEKDKIYVSTSGLAVLRTVEQGMVVTNIMTPEFLIQHAAKVSGSIMASISDEDLGNIMISDRVDRRKADSLINFSRMFHQEC